MPRYLRWLNSLPPNRRALFGVVHFFGCFFLGGLVGFVGLLVRWVTGQEPYLLENKMLNITVWFMVIGAVGAGVCLYFDRRARNRPPAPQDLPPMGAITRQAIRSTLDKLRADDGVPATVKCWRWFNSLAPRRRLRVGFIVFFLGFCFLPGLLLMFVLEVASFIGRDSGSPFGVPLLYATVGAFGAGILLRIEGRNQQRKHASR